VNVTGWSRGPEVTGGGEGIVSQAGVALLRHLADQTGLATGLSRAMAAGQSLVRDRRPEGPTGWVSPGRWSQATSA
jgi:electron transfer flavoprotein alpha subunit